MIYYFVELFLGEGLYIHTVYAQLSAKYCTLVYYGTENSKQSCQRNIRNDETQFIWQRENYLKFVALVYLEKQV